MLANKYNNCGSISFVLQWRYLFLLPVLVKLSIAYNAGDTAVKTDYVGNNVTSAENTPEGYSKVGSEDKDILTD